jgi:hypothetical protein
VWGWGRKENSQKKEKKQRSRKYKRAGGQKIKLQKKIKNKLRSGLRKEQTKQSQPGMAQG